MTLPFMKARSGGGGFIVVNLADTLVTDLAEMARRLCLPPLGVGADGLAALAHLGRSRFTVSFLCPDGTGLMPGDPVLRCCAAVIRARYGYRSLTLVAGSASFELRVAGRGIGVRAVAASEAVVPFGVASGLPRYRARAGPPARAAPALAGALAGQPGPPRGLPGQPALGQPAQGQPDEPGALPADNGMPVTGQDAPARQEAWRYSPAALLFEGEFPWP